MIASVTTTLTSDASASFMASKPSPAAITFVTRALQRHFQIAPDRAVVFDQKHAGL